jgi:hypothetical protein
LLFLCVTRHISFTHHTAPISRPPRHYLVTPVMLLVLVFAQNLHGCRSSCLQSSCLLTCVVKKFCSPSSFADLESCHPQPNLGAAATRQQAMSPLGRARAPLPGRNVISRTKPQIVGSNNPPVPKTDTQDIENLDKVIFS